MEKNYFARPRWQAGFRPFFPLAALAGAIFPLLWVLVLYGVWTPARPVLAIPGLSTVQWHAHEMFFGFGGAVLVGFLLTASKNWVGIRGQHGFSLFLLACLWALERLSLNASATWPPGLFWPANLAFAVLAVALLLHTLIRHRAKDSFAPDNLFFIIALPLLLPAKILLLIPETFATGVSLTLAIFRMAFLLMLERTVSAFMRGAFQREIRVNPAVDRSIKWLALSLCLGPWLPGHLLIGLEWLLAGLLVWRLTGWYPGLAMRRLDIGIMYVGYGALTLQLVLDGLALAGLWQATGSLALHVFTLGAMGTIVPAMFVRIANGHTGRRIVFGTLERTMLYLMLCSFVMRTMGVQLVPAAYRVWLTLAATGWLLAFGLWLGRYARPLGQPRVDGRPG